MTSAMSCPCDIRTSACRSFATISSGLCFFFGISVLLHVKRHSSGRTTFQGEDHDNLERLQSCSTSAGASKRTHSYFATLSPFVLEWRRAGTGTAAIRTVALLQGE